MSEPLPPASALGLNSDSIQLDPRPSHKLTTNCFDGSLPSQDNQRCAVRLSSPPRSDSPALPILRSQSSRASPSLFGLVNTGFILPLRFISLDWNALQVIPPPSSPHRSLPEAVGLAAAPRAGWGRSHVLCGLLLLCDWVEVSEE